ncbi:MAG: transporter substrate-binding domain-containing protein [Desulfobacula sp.]|jgi:two-component system, sensor histidine kinase|nr:transporter substrate-binding domain-containing protein [Desulfobacula sp.]
MLINRSIFIFGIVLFIGSFSAMPSIAKIDKNSKLIPHIIKSASELDYPPFSIVRSDGTADGFSVELLKAVVHTVGRDISFEVAPWNEIKQNLINEHFDVLPLVSYSIERDRVLDFTTPYLRMHGTIFVRKGEKVIRGEADLKNKEILVMQGEGSYQSI